MRQLATYSRWSSHLLINSINDFISTQTVSSGRRIHYNDARFPLAHPESFEDERLMMEILRGSPALSAFRINKLLARFQAANLPVSAIYAEYIHFADLNAPLSADDRERLARLLQYGPSLSSHTPTGKLLLVTPRPGTISPGLLKLPISLTTAVWRRLCVLSAAWRITLKPQP